MTNSKRSARNDDAAAVECKLLAKIRNFSTAAASIAAVHESAFGTKRIFAD
jgi:hypothetical protein